MNRDDDADDGGDEGDELDASGPHEEQRDDLETKGQAGLRDLGCHAAVRHVAYGLENRIEGIVSVRDEGHGPQGGRTQIQDENRHGDHGVFGTQRLRAKMLVFDSHACVIRSQSHENRVLDPAQHLQDAHELDATARRIGASAEENGDDDEDDDAIGYRPANLLGIHGLHAACRRGRDHGGQAVLHKPAQAREKSLARHDPSHEGDEHHNPQRIHPQLGIAPDMLETANPRIRIHAKANSTGNHERAQHELQWERVVIDEIRGMGHEATRADGGQRQPEPVHDRIDGMKSQEKADQRRRNGSDEGEASVHAQYQKAGVADARARTLAITSLRHHEDPRALAKEPRVHGDDDDRQGTREGHDHTPGDLGIAHGVHVAHERDTCRGKRGHRVEERVEPRIEGTGQEQRNRADEPDDDPAKSHEQEGPTPVKATCLEEAQRRTERQAHAYAGNKRPELAKLPENKRDDGGHAHGRARHQDEHAKVMTDGRDIGPVKTGQHNMRIIAVIAVAGTGRDGVRRPGAGWSDQPVPLLSGSALFG